MGKRYRGLTDITMITDGSEYKEVDAKNDSK
jgi:hypothetical protein